MEDFPEKSVILVEEDTGLAKSIYAQYIAAEMASAGKDVCYVTDRDADGDPQPDEPAGDFTGNGFSHRRDARDGPGRASRSAYPHSKGDLVIVDQFSLYFLDTSLAGFREAISRIIAAAKTGRIFLLLIDREILPERHEALLRAMADGVIQITTVAEGDKLKRYLNIPKMQGARLLEKMLPFTVTDEGFLIDTRERHG